MTWAAYECEMSDEEAGNRAYNANMKILQNYRTRDVAGRGNCRRCDRKGFLNRGGFCSVDCENGQVALPYQK